MTGRIAAMSTQRSISTTPGATSSSSSVTSVTGIFSVLALPLYPVRAL